MRIYHADGGAFIEPPKHKFHDAYFSVIDESNKVVRVDKNLGDIYSGLAEFLAIKWVVDNIKERPITITSDCQTALAWARKGAHTKKHQVERLDLTNINVEYQHNNFADQYNARHISPKKDQAYYYHRWLKKGKVMKSSKKKPRIVGKRKANKELTLFKL